LKGERGGIVVWGNVLQVGRSRAALWPWGQFSL